MLIGIGSFLFHTVATRWAAWADVIPILVFILLYLWLILRRYFRWPWWAALPALAVFFLFTLFGEVIVPAMLRGGAMYVPAMLAIIATGIALLPRQPPAGRAMLAAAGVFAVSFTARTLDMPVCSSFPPGTHFLWHLLNGLLLYLLMRIAILHPPVRQAYRIS